MDETLVWSDMVFDTTIDITGTDNVTVKSTGYEKSCVPVCLAAKAYGARCIIPSFPNAWINTELIQVWVDKVLGSFSFRL